MPELGFQQTCLLNNHKPFCPLEAPGLPHRHARAFMDGRLRPILALLPDPACSWAAGPRPRSRSTMV